MKKAILSALLAAVLFVALPAVAGAATHYGRPAAKPAFRLGLPENTSDRAAFVPLAATLTGNAVLNGHVYGPTGSALTGASVGWYVSSVDGEAYGDATTDYSGAYRFSGLPAANANGVVWTAPGNGFYELDYLDRSWSDPGPTTFDFTPGTIGFSLTPGGPWPGWSTVWITLAGNDPSGRVMSFSSANSTTTPSAWALPGSYTTGSVNFWSDEGAEVTLAHNVVAQQTSLPMVTVDEAHAQRLMVSSPYWASGKPGTIVKLKLANFPAGFVSDFYGYQDFSTTVKTFSSYTSQGATNEYKKVTIPSTAKPGFHYYIGLQHRSGLLSLETPFQVCSLNGPNKSRYSYRLSGRVPIQGSTAPNDPGTAKWIYLYRRYTEAGQPKGDPTKHGWQYVKRYKTDSYGKFLTGSLDGNKTTWWIVYYPGDNSHWGAFTSVKKVIDY